MTINRVVLSGNLTRDPEVRSTGSGTEVMEFGIAVNEGRKNKVTGEWDNYANFVDCSMFGQRVIKLSGMMHKGDKVCVEGRIRYSTWEKDGVKRSKLSVIVDEVEFMQKKSEPMEDYYDDIPF